MIGDLSYAHPWGQASVDQHFNDVMAWSQDGGVHAGLGEPRVGDAGGGRPPQLQGPVRPPQPVHGAGRARAGCCGEDWVWFDAGGVRFISYPEPYSSSTWSTWQIADRPDLRSRPGRPVDHFIVTFGHRRPTRPGLHPGEADLAACSTPSATGTRSTCSTSTGTRTTTSASSPIHGVTHITAAGGGLAARAAVDERPTLAPPSARCTSSTCASTSPATGMRIEAVCGPATSSDDMAVHPGERDRLVHDRDEPAAAAAAPGDPLRRQGQRRAARTTARARDAAVLHDQAPRPSRVAPGRRSSSPRAPTTSRSPCRPRDRHRTDHLRGRARRDASPSPAGRTASTCPARATSRSRGSTSPGRPTTGSSSRRTPRTSRSAATT